MYSIQTECCDGDGGTKFCFTLNKKHMKISWQRNHLVFPINFQTRRLKPIDYLFSEEMLKNTFDSTKFWAQRNMRKWKVEAITLFYLVEKPQIDCCLLNLMRIELTIKSHNMNFKILVLFFCFFVMPIKSD